LESKKKAKNFLCFLPCFLFKELPFTSVSSFFYHFLSKKPPKGGFFVFEATFGKTHFSFFSFIFFIY